MSAWTRWTDADGVEWECDAYDHGPFCRQCRVVAGEAPSSPVVVPADTYVSAGRGAVGHLDGPYPDATARKALGALHDHGLLTPGRGLVPPSVRSFVARALRGQDISPLLAGLLIPRMSDLGDGEIDCLRCQDTGWAKARYVDLHRQPLPKTLKLRDRIPCTSCPEGFVHLRTGWMSDTKRVWYFVNDDGQTVWLFAKEESQ